MKLLFSLLFFLILAMILSHPNLYACGGSEGGCGCIKNIPTEYKNAAPAACPGSCMCHVGSGPSPVKS